MTVAPQTMRDGSAYAIIRMALTNPSVLDALVPNLTENGQHFLEEYGISAPEQRDELLRILTLAVAGAQLQDSTVRQQVSAAQTALQETMNTASRMRNGLSQTIEQIDRAFRQTMWMYLVTFYLGVTLIVAALVFAVVGHRDVLSMVLGGLGTANFLAFFITKPPERLQSSRASLAQLQCVLFAWFNDFYNQNVLMSQVNAGQKLDLAPYAALSDAILKHTSDMMELLQRYCKLVENPQEPREARSDGVTERAG